MTKIIKFTQVTCNPCKVLGGFLDSIEVEPDEEVVIDADVDGKEKAEKYDIMSTPTLVAVDADGKEVGRVSGINPVQINEFLETFGKL